MMFSNAIQSQKTTTTNGMTAYNSSMNYCVDLFGQIAACRGSDIIPLFIKAYDQNREISLKIVQWARDVRGGAGERQVFKNILKYLETKNIEDAKLLAMNASNIGRFDDILEFETQEMKYFVFDIFKTALQNGNPLAAKWAPNESKSNKKLARELMKYLGMSPRQYRKMIVSLKQVVETQMCDKKFDDIDFSRVPSVAMSRYNKAFYRNSEQHFSSYIESVTKGFDKINASCVFPHDVIRSVWNEGNTFSPALEAQWNSLPNYVGDASILPVVDVSGSMLEAKLSGSLTALHVAVSLGLYISDKNRGDFKDCFVTFSGEPQVQLLKGSISDKLKQLNDSLWNMSTNIERVFDKILEVAIEGNVSEEDMPKYILILSDMQFNQCITHYTDNSMDIISKKYSRGGYKIPCIIFWNLNSYNNFPVRFDDKGTVLVSGFSPHILKHILRADVKSITPESLMIDAISDPRYIT